MWDSLNKPTGWKWPNKQIKPGSHSLIELAHSLQDKKLTLKVPVDPTHVAQEQSTSPEAPPPTLEFLGANSCNNPPASSFLLDGGWVLSVQNSVKGAIFMEESDEDSKRRANVLSNIMKARFRTHVDKKVHRSCRGHYSLDWFKKQIPRLAAMIVMSQQVKDEPDNFDANGCLLKHPVSCNGVGNVFLFADGLLLEFEGSYLYYDCVNHKWIRSGKVSGRRMNLRLLDHKNNCLNAGTSSSTGSQLYTRYPSKHSHLVRQLISDSGGFKPWDGYYEDLRPFCGFCYNPKGHFKGLVNTSQGIFEWDGTTLNRIRQNQKLGSTLEKKQLTMVSFLFELGYDLLLDTTHNLSTYPGFEAAGLRAKEKVKN